jgi:hypothetical protein
VHIEALSSVGGWGDEELRAARRAINSHCLQTVPDMVRKIMATFGAE